MNLNKCYEFFQPEMVRGRVNIIGCGAIGSTVAENLVRFGITKLSLFDFDNVESHNISNQMFREVDIGKKKVEALADYLCEINPQVGKDIKLVDSGWTGQRLSGYVFLCVDSIDVRRDIANQCKGSRYVKGMFDFRMRLTDAQHYAADWGNAKMIEDFIASMDFTQEEAKAATPVSACNLELSVVPTVRTIVSYGVTNFINFVKDGNIKKMILADPFHYQVDAF